MHNWNKTHKKPPEHKYLRSFMLLLTALLWISTSMDAAAQGRVQITGDRVVVVIDPGHGGENEGTIENGFQEKSMTLKTAMAMYEELTKYDNVTVFLTRTDDRDMSLKERAEFAESVNADFLFSIHYNASINHNLFGSEVWVSAQAPYNVYGYQFGYVQLSAMQEMGLFLRGIKTRLNDRQTDYYGIIREATQLGIPSVIIEHCHVDESRDVPFCDTNEKLEAFGRTDATTVAKYFGLSSELLGVDHGEIPLSLPDAGRELPVESTLKDETLPDVCMISLMDTDYNNGAVTIEVSATDYDSVLLYYDYSIDGGIIYSPLQPWPGSNALNGSYSDTFTLTLTIPSGKFPRIMVRAYNLFDGFTESNELSSFALFSYGEEMAEKHSTDEYQENTIAPKTDSVITWTPASNEQSREEDIRLRTLLTVCLLCAALLFMLTLLLQLRLRRRRKKAVSASAISASTISVKSDTASTVSTSAYSKKKGRR